jgi:hypothetical protein
VAEPQLADPAVRVSIAHAGGDRREIEVSG